MLPFFVLVNFGLGNYLPANLICCICCNSRDLAEPSGVGTRGCRHVIAPPPMMDRAVVRPTGKCRAQGRGRRQIIAGADRICHAADQVPPCPALDPYLPAIRPNCAASRASVAACALPPRGWPTGSPGPGSPAHPGPARCPAPAHRWRPSARRRVLALPLQDQRYRRS